MEHTTSADGTEIAYEVHGGTGASRAGTAPVICLHGTGVTRQVWGRFLASADGAWFVVPDRRGRGASGDAASWSFERELADVAALAAAEAPGESVTLFGSSFGGLLSLRAAERVEVDRLALYEPPMPLVTVENGAVSVADEVEQRLAAGDREGAVRLFFEEATGASGVEEWPIWPDCIALAETIIRECHVVESFDPGDVSPSVPTLLFRGVYSLPYLQNGIDLLRDRLTDTRVVDIEAGHAGVAAAPEQVASAFDEFVAATR